jgi:transposase
MSTTDIARLQNVSESRVRQLLSEYRRTGYIHTLNKPGRPLRPVSYHEISTVLFRQYPCNALTLESILMNRHGIKIPHNRIHKILKDHKLASNDTNKQRRRKWIKYERKHSMSLWHTYQIKDDRWKDKWLIAYLDDASRFEPGYGVFEESTTCNAISVLDGCIARYGKPLHKDKTGFAYVKFSHDWREIHLDNDKSIRYYQFHPKNDIITPIAHLPLPSSEYRLLICLNFCHELVEFVK